ncbi:LOW QUALITY PROTEIN: hypothetical protein AAY473_015681 [Plecturocebus cupreus]
MAGVGLSKVAVAMAPAAVQGSEGCGSSGADAKANGPRACHPESHYCVGPGRAQPPANGETARSAMEGPQCGAGSRTVWRLGRGLGPKRESGEVAELQWPWLRSGSGTCFLDLANYEAAAPSLLWGQVPGLSEGPEAASPGSTPYQPRPVPAIIHSQRHDLAGSSAR